MCRNVSRHPARPWPFADDNQFLRASLCELSPPEWRFERLYKYKYSLNDTTVIKVPVHQGHMRTLLSWGCAPSHRSLPQAQPETSVPSS